MQQSRMNQDDSWWRRKQVAVETARSMMIEEEEEEEEEEVEEEEDVLQFHPSTMTRARGIVAPVRQNLKLGAAVRAPSPWCGRVVISKP